MLVFWGEIELHVWEDDPELSQTLAHESYARFALSPATAFSHCSSRTAQPTAGTLIALTSNAEREARLNSRDPDSHFRRVAPVRYSTSSISRITAIYVSDNFR